MKKLLKKKNKIISITPQKRRNNRYSVQLDNGEIFGLSRDVYISYKLSVGQNISNEQLISINREEETYRIRNSAFKLLSYRMRSKSELYHRLLQKKYEVNLIESVINELETKEYINDREFANAFIRDRVKNKKLGPAAIQNAIGVHQISAEIIDDTMQKVYSEFPFEDLILSIIKKRSKIVKEKTIKERKKMIDYLKRKGYHWSSIQPILAQTGWLEF